MTRLFTLTLLMVTNLVCAFDHVHPGDSSRSRSFSARWILPHYIPIQYAGNIGWLSTGIGYATRRDNYRLSLLYGYSPEAISGVPIHTVTAKNIFILYHFPVSQKQTLLPYLACGVSVEIGGQSFFIQPAEMPSGYYNYPKSLHFIPSAGMKLQYSTEQFKFFRAIEVFAEASTVDVYILSKIMSSEVRMSQIISLSLGMHFTLK